MGAAKAKPVATAAGRARTARGECTTPKAATTAR